MSFLINIVFKTDQNAEEAALTALEADQNIRQMIAVEASLDAESAEEADEANEIWQKNFLSVFLTTRIVGDDNAD